MYMIGNDGKVVLECSDEIKVRHKTGDVKKNFL